MSKLISKKYGTSYAGQTVILPIIGESTFEEDGTIDIKEELVPSLISATKESFDFAIYGSEESKGKSKSKQQEEIEETIDPETLALIDGLEKASKTELLELAKETTLDLAQVAKMSSAKLKKELIKILIDSASKSKE